VAGTAHADPIAIGCLTSNETGRLTSMEPLDIIFYLITANAKVAAPLWQHVFTGLGKDLRLI
jgi:hypothetical protein